MNISLLLVQSILTTDECKHYKIRPPPEGEDAKKNRPGKCERKMKKEERQRENDCKRKKLNAKRTKERAKRVHQQ